MERKREGRGGRKNCRGVKGTRKERWSQWEEGKRQEDEDRCYDAEEGCGEGHD